jgi:hypothetical protein
VGSCDSGTLEHAFARVAAHAGLNALERRVGSLVLAGAVEQDLPGRLGVEPELARAALHVLCVRLELRDVGELEATLRRRMREGGDASTC